MNWPKPTHTAREPEKQMSDANPEPQSSKNNKRPWWRRLFGTPPQLGFPCVADDCDEPAAPHDGPFCPAHNWDNWRATPRGGTDR